MKFKFVYIPRFLGILVAIFISIFALDVFSEFVYPEVILALAMHLIPTATIVILLAVAWRWEMVGGFLFLILGVGMVFFFNQEELIGYLIVQGPVFLLGILFLISEILKRKHFKN